MAVEALTATRRGPVALTDANANTVPTRANVVAVTSTVEVTAAASATSTYVMARIPSDARLVPESRIYWDDLASTGSPTVDVGLDNGDTTDPDALSNGHDVTASGNGLVLSAIADMGKMAWELAGLSSDPGGFFDVYASLVDADANTGGTVTMHLVYTVD